MGKIVDSENVINSLETAPDRLRAEIGAYHTIVDTPTGQELRTANFRSGIKNDFVYEYTTAEPQLFETKKARILISGYDEQFRDQTQWREYISQTIKTGTSFSDHQFSFDGVEIENSLVKNHHDATYEDVTKNAPTNHLLNWNLIAYPFKSEIGSVQKIADIRTGFDPESYEVAGDIEFKRLVVEYPSRILNYSGTTTEIEEKQRNIFDLQRPTILQYGDIIAPIVLNGPLVPLESFPYYYSKTLPRIAYGDPRPGRRFNSTISNCEKRKNIFQLIKQDSYFSTRNFNIGMETMNVKLYNFLDMITTTGIVGITEQSDELFLVPESETDFDSIIGRFVDQVNAVRFLGGMRDFVNNNNRSVSELIKPPTQNSKNFFLGYKIEKYLDRDIGLPIQTYYTNDKNFYDTQLKYGRKYIYKTKLLIGILGSTYRYSNLFMSKNETEMMGEDGSIMGMYPEGFMDIVSEKYRAYVDVEATPSFQVLEYEVDVDEVAFVDTPTLPPQVDFRNNSKKPNVEFFFSPMFGRVESVRPNPTTPEELIRPLNPLTEEDRRIADLVALSKTDGANIDYFTGIYEIYRMAEPPKKESDFTDHFLTSVDDGEDLISGKLVSAFSDNMNAHFEDFIAPNRKYYYAFRALTYHGTPSNLTVPFEVELLKDSDEYKINVSQYKYPSDKNYTHQKSAKRIIKVVPNIERLFFDDLEATKIDKSSYKLDGDSMLTKNETTTFKIRVTSKHTGKKIDINLNLKLVEDENSFTQN